MNATLLPIRLVFVALCASGGWLLSYAVKEWDEYRIQSVIIGLCLGLLMVLVDLMLKGFSLRGLSAITFGLGVGTVISWMLISSPLLRAGDPQLLYLFQMIIFLGTTYLCTVLALRGKDEFNLIIPYVRFVPHEVDVPLVVVDTTALIDGRIARICQTGFINVALVIPRFVIHDLHAIADAGDAHKQTRGRRGIDTLSELRRIKHLDVRIHDSEVEKAQDAGAKLVFLAQSMRAKLLTTDYNLAKLAEFHGVHWLNLSALAKAVRPELVIGEVIEAELVKPGKEPEQGVGFLDDGSMVVVNNGRSLIGRTAAVEITSVLPSSAGKMIFARVYEA